MLRCMARRHFMISWALSVSLFLVGCERSPNIVVPSSADRITLKSPAFAADTLMPIEYTCDGANISPPLVWGNTPDGAESLVLWMDDPDAPGGSFTHWVIYDIPPSTRDLPEAIPPNESLDQGGTQGKNSFRDLGYGGPCPPKGTHRYRFRLYALKQNTGLPPNAPITKVAQQMENHIVGLGELTAPYTRQAP